MEIQSYTKPQLPLSWDYNVSIKDVKQFIYKWKTLSQNIAEELWIARAMLSKVGGKGQKKNLNGSIDPLITWSEYCEEIGSSRGVVNKWLKQWFETVHVSQNSGESEWYTPKKYIEAARESMGSIDLDPASNSFANKMVQAAEYFDEETNGLINSWSGNVWLNPPYEQSLIKQFSNAVIANKDNCNQIIILVNNATETEWLQNMIKVSDVICLVKSRIKFIDKAGEASNAPLQGQVILYIGNNVNNFISNFNKFGICMEK